MFTRLLPRLGRIAIWSGATIAVLGLGLFLFAASGLYNVAASRGHFAITSWFLEFAMRRSVAMHSLGIDVPSLADPGLVRLGAGHYGGGCAPCHGAPGEPNNRIVQHMLPAPPDLSKKVPTWSPAEVFWIVKHGLKYTGMPAWPALRRDDEVWALVAFLRRLPGMSPTEYRALASGNAVPQRERSAHEVAHSGAGDVGLTTCVRCHGDETETPTSPLIPKLAGQSLPYLERALRQFADGSRPSGIMGPVASELDATSIARLAQHYANLPANRSPTAARQVPGDRVERGRKIAVFGVPASGVPPCLACHGESSAAIFPRLAGQYAPYIVTQLWLFREKIRSGTAYAQIMVPIASRLSESQAQDVATYFASLAADTNGSLSRSGVTGAAPETSQ